MVVTGRLRGEIMIIATATTAIYGAVVNEVARVSPPVRARYLPPVGGDWFFHISLRYLSLRAGPATLGYAFL